MVVFGCKEALPTNFYPELVYRGKEISSASIDLTTGLRRDYGVATGESRAIGRSESGK